MKLVFEDIENLHNFTSCPDVNPSGIKRFTYAPLINATNMYFGFTHKESFLQFLKLMHIIKLAKALQQMKSQKHIYKI